MKKSFRERGALHPCNAPSGLLPHLDRHAELDRRHAVARRSAVTDRDGLPLDDGRNARAVATGLAVALALGSGNLGNAVATRNALALVAVSSDGRRDHLEAAVALGAGAGIGRAVAGLHRTSRDVSVGLGVTGRVAVAHVASSGSGLGRPRRNVVHEVAEVPLAEDDVLLRVENGGVPRGVSAEARGRLAALVGFGEEHEHVLDGLLRLVPSHALLDEPVFELLAERVADHSFHGAPLSRCAGKMYSGIAVRTDLPYASGQTFTS